MSTESLSLPDFLTNLPPQFEPLQPFLNANLMPYIKIRATEVEQDSTNGDGFEWCHDPLELWQSKIGGYPYLPKGTSYPADKTTGQMMMFLMQINCTDLPKITDLNLPPKGLLQFYVGLDVPMCELSPEQHRILYFPDIDHDKNNLITDFGFLSEPASAMEWYEYVYSLTFSLHQDVFWNARRWLDTTFQLPEDLQDLRDDFHEWISDYEEQCSLYGARGRVNKLGGHPEIHSDVGETVEEAQGVLLLELQHDFNSDDNFYFYVKDQDLADQNFSRVEFYFLRN